MSKFEYQVSVIVPVYNASEYLRDSLESLANQTIGEEEMEVLLVNDGSTDESLAICMEYARIFPNFRVFSQENAGVSAARNLGIKEAKGKYLMYLDADDMLSEGTVKNVAEFFERHYDEVDVVTYPEEAYYSNGMKRERHLRYQTLKKTGIYDAVKNPFLFQVRLNIAVKNKIGDNLLFDCALGYHEDQKYCSELLREKLKLGFVNNCEYKYMLHDGSITGENTNPVALFDKTTKYWEELFESFGEEPVPAYYQALYLHDLNWKLTQNCLLPYHYPDEKLEAESGRLWKLLRKVDVDMIMKHPAVDNFHRFYFLQKKGCCCTPLVKKESFSLVSGEKTIFERNRFELIFNKCRVFGTRLLMQCTLKSRFFNFHEKPRLYAVLNGEEMTELELFFSSMSYYKCKTVTNNFWGFYFECSLKETENIKFQVEVDGILFDTTFYMMPTSPFVIRNAVVRGTHIISFRDNEFLVEEADETKREEVLRENDAAIRKLDKNAYILRRISEEYAGKKIWLYYDCKGVDFDNGYLQFLHDFDMEDGTERYYILNNDWEQSGHFFEKKHEGFIVPFESEWHKKLFIRAEKIVTAYIEEVNLYPFAAAFKKYYRDLMNAEIIYLQHGILHASLPWKYTPEKVEVDRVVISSEFERKNFTTKYCFRKQDMIACGMPRFETIDRSKKMGNRILFAPSWRMYLIGQCVDTVWELAEEKFLVSRYYREFQAFLNSEKLSRLLEENDLYLDFKIHPIFRPYLKYFAAASERIAIAGNTVDDAGYCMFITDFSSYVFNFAYLGRSILYFAPDYTEFLAGLNQYRRLDLPFEEGFGEFVQNVPDAVAGIERAVKDHFVPKRQYAERMENFFLPMSGCREKIYQQIREEAN